MERDFLIGMLWPESDGPAGQESLRKTLGDLRGALGSEAWRLQSPARGRLLLDLSGDAFCDVLHFDFARVRWEKSGKVAFAEEAVGLYRGPLLEGLTEEWVLRERAGRDEAALGLLEGLARRALEQGDPSRALALVRRAEKLEPLRESVQRMLYRALTEAGDFPAAQRAFRDFRIRLREEANLSPDPETSSVMRSLAESPRRVAPPTPALSEENAAQSHAPHTSEGLRHFPQFLTPLQGRGGELERLRESLVAAPLTTLVGMGGVGKTRLAVAVAQEREAAVFVDLAPFPRTTSPEEILAALLRAVGVAGDSAQERLRELLQESEILLVLDNGEPVLESLRIALGKLLTPEQRVRFLVTSREPLGVRGERVLRLEPLAPAEALLLFQERAEASGVSWRDDETEVVAEICRRLEGLPLALELAAARVGLLPPRKLLERLASPLRLLSGAHLGLPERHRSLRVVLEDSYTLLEPEEQRALEELSVFVGPFRLEDAEAVLETATLDPLDRLEALHRASLLVVRQGGWTFLQPVRDFAAECLTADSERTKQARYRHAQRQAVAAEEAIAQLSAGVFASARRRLWGSAEDRAAALAWAALEDETELAVRLAWTQARYLYDARRNAEALRLLEQVLTLLPPPQLRVILLQELAELHVETGDSEQAGALIEEALLLDEGPRATLLRLKGSIALFQGRFQEARQLLNEAFDRGLAENRPVVAALALHLYAIRARRSNDPTLLDPLRDDLEEARRRLEALLQQDRKTGAVLQALTVLHRARKDGPAALACVEELVALQERNGQAEPVVDAQQQRGNLLFGLGRPEEAEEVILAALRGHYALGNTDAARQLLVDGMCSAKFSRWFGSVRRLRERLTPEVKELDPTYRARMVLFEGCALMRYGTPTEARACLIEAAQRFRWLGDAATETILRRLAAWSLMEEGDLEQAQYEGERLVVAPQVAGIDEVGRRRVFLAEVARRQGRPEFGLTLLTGLEGLPEGQPARGWCLLDLGRLEEAEEALRRGCELGEVEVSVEWLAYSSVGLAQLAQWRGEIESARAGYEAILARALRAEDRVAERLVRVRQESL